MKKPFFANQEAAAIAGCTQRLLEYRREKGVGIPAARASCDRLSAAGAIAGGRDGAPNGRALMGTGRSHPEKLAR